MRRDDDLYDRARSNRRKLNYAERRLWWELKGNRYGVKFRRQHVILGYLVDFACVTIKLIVESDGSQHSNSEADEIRDQRLRDAGWTILRFWAWEVFEENQMVRDTISNTVGRLEDELECGRAVHHPDS
jgi:very-short-patch-repair endonuclease